MGFFVSGILFSLYQHNLLLVAYINPWQKYDGQKKSKNSKVVVPLLYWSGNHWNIEESLVLKNDNEEEFLLHIVTSWLAIIHGENNTLRLPNVQSLMVGVMGTDLYISFSHNWLPSHCSVAEKSLYILGLLYTVHSNNEKIKTVQFLVDHKCMVDDHLNFSYPWSIKASCKDFSRWCLPLPCVTVKKG